jgi:hypothetical protein
MSTTKGGSMGKAIESQHGHTFQHPPGAGREHQKRRNIENT